MASKYAYTGKKKTVGSQAGSNLSGLNQRDKQTVSLDPRESDGSLNRGIYQTTANQYGSTGRQTAQVNQTPVSGNTGVKTAQMGQTPISGNTGTRTTGATAQTRMQELVKRQKAAAEANARAAAQRDAAIRNPQKAVGTGGTATYTPTGEQTTRVTAQMSQTPISGSTGPQQKGGLGKFSFDQMSQTPISGTTGPAAAGNGAGGTGGYTPSDTVQQAQTLLQEHMANAPGAYSSQYADQIQQVMNQIMNRRDFSYDMNSDALYRQYADQYTRQAQMAMMDTMGQAAAMTGGYGNSYAQTVGQQTFQNYMQQLNDVMPELYQLAAEQYAREGEDMMNQYSMLVAQDEQAYGRYRDQMSDYDSRLQRLTEDARYAYEQDYGRYLNDRDYQYQKDRDTVGDQQWQDQFAHQKEQDAIGNQQWEDQFAHQKEQDAIGNEQWQKQFDEMASQWEAEYGLSRDQFEEMIRQYDSELGYQRERDAISDSQWERQFNEMAEQWEAEYGLSRDQFNEMIRQWDEEMGYQRERDVVSDSQWEAEYGLSRDQFNEMASQWEAEFGLERDQYETMIRQWEEEMGYQRERDAVSDSQWERQFDEMAEQWEAEFGLERDQYETMIRQWEEEMGYQRERDAIEDDQWQDSFDEDKRRYDEESKYREERDSIEDDRYDQEWNRQVQRDQEDDERWAAEFEAAQDRYNDSVSAGNSDGKTESYEMSVSDYKYWNEQWGSVTTDAQAEALAERMEAAGVPFDLVALWYKEFSGGYEPEDGPENTEVEDETPEEPVFSAGPSKGRGYLREIFGPG